MNPAYLWIAAAVVAGATGTFFQAIGSAKPEKEPARKARRRQIRLALGPLLTALAVYCLWSGQQLLLQQAAAKPVLDAFVDTQKTLHIRNPGTIDVEDVKIDATVYVLKTADAPEGGGHIIITGIDSFSKPSLPVYTQDIIPKGGGELRFDLANSQTSNLLPICDGIPDLATPQGHTVYCFRILCRNAVTKQRLIKYLLTGPFKNFPDMYGEYRGTAIGGGYESSNKTFEIRNLIRSHQMSLFDDDPSALYRD